MRIVPMCRAALKHLDMMMFRDDPNEQQCGTSRLTVAVGRFGSRAHGVG